MIARSGPSYSPMARLHVTACSMPRHRGHVRLSIVPTRQEGSGSPQTSHNGGVNALTARQHASHTGPRVGSPSGRSHAAQIGARSTDRRGPMIFRLKAEATGISDGSTHRTHRSTPGTLGTPGTRGTSGTPGTRGTRGTPIRLHAPRFVPHLPTTVPANRRRASVA